MSPHYYDRETGHLLPNVELKVRPGEFREANLGDARKVQALPSVTTLMSILNKPALTRWAVEQGIKAAATIDWQGISPEGEWLAAVYSQSQDFVHWAADQGTAIHAYLHTKLSGIPLMFPPIMPRSEEAAEYLVGWLAANGFEIEASEKHFVNTTLGWGGTVDLLGTHYGEPMLADLKTQSDPLTFHDPDYGLQLAGYSLGLGLDPDIKRISIILNRDEFAVKQKLWTENARYDEAFMGLAQLWMLLSKYDPRTE